MHRRDVRANLERELKTIERELMDTAQIMNDLSSKKHHLEKKVSALKNQLTNYAPRNLQVSDHCLLRYLERYYNLDMEKYRQEVLDLIGTSENSFGSVKYAGFVIKNGIVITYYPPEENNASPT